MDASVPRLRTSTAVLSAAVMTTAAVVVAGSKLDQRRHAWDAAHHGMGCKHLRHQLIRVATGYEA